MENTLNNFLNSLYEDLKNIEDTIVVTTTIKTQNVKIIISSHFVNTLKNIVSNICLKNSFKHIFKYS